jgi:hypothetical protein
MRKFTTALFLLATLMLPASSYSWTKPAADEVKSDEVKSVRWEGDTDLDMLKQVRTDLGDATAKDSKIKVLRVSLMSPGGPVITSLEIAHLVRKASDKGLIVEIHAEALCASGCTWVLASGTPGKRYISKYALFLVHPIQGEMGCVQHVDKPKAPDEKLINALLDIARDAYMRYTGRDKATVENWLSCGQEQVGGGDLAKSLNMADQLED